LQPVSSSSLAVERWHFNVSGIRTRRVFAFFIDFMMILSILSMFFMLALVLAIPTFGFSFLALFASLPWLMPCIALLYNGTSISGPYCGTIGMRMMEIKVTRVDGSPASFLQAAAHAVLFYLPGMVFLFPNLYVLLILLLPTFFEPRKRMLHDILVGLMVSRSDR